MDSKKKKIVHLLEFKYKYSLKINQRLIIFTQSTYDPASTYRAIQYIPYFSKLGWEIIHYPNKPDRQWVSTLKNRLLRAVHYRIGRIIMKLNRLIDILRVRKTDVVFVNRDLGNEMFFERLLLWKNKHVIFDYDDAIYIGKNNDKVSLMCQKASHVIPGNSTLAQFAKKYTKNISIIPTTIDITSYVKQANLSFFEDTPFTLGWMGSYNSFKATLLPFLPFLASLQNEIGFQFKLISSKIPDNSPSNLSFEFIPWYRKIEGALHQHFHIGIMPLEDTAFQRGKCGFKLLQYMGNALPVIGSPIGVNQQIIQDGINGFHAQTKAEWTNAIKKLKSDSHLAFRMGQSGRKIVEQQYSLQHWLPTLNDILKLNSESCVAFVEK